MPTFVDYLDEYVVEEGIQRFLLPKVYTFVCSIDEPHIVETDVIYQSDMREGTFVFCSKHREFVDVSVKRELVEV